MADYRANLTPIFKQNLPKKCVFTKRIAIKKDYDCQASLWVPDTAYSKYPPGIGFTLRHGKDASKQHVRFIFGGPQELVDFMRNLDNFIKSNLEGICKHHGEAFSEWAKCRENVVEFKRKASL